MYYIITYFLIGLCGEMFDFSAEENCFMVQWVYMAKTRSTSRAASAKASKSSKGTTTRKRSTTKKKATTPEYELPGGFWRQVTALLLLVLVVALVYIWLMKGDPTSDFPRLVDQGLFTAIGYAEFALPVILVFLAVKIFRSEYNKLPIIVWVAAVLMVIWIAGLAGVSTIGTINPGGGVVGEWLNEMIAGVASDTTVMILFYVFLIFVTALFLLQMSPAALFRTIGGAFHTTEKVEGKAKAGANAAAKKGADLVAEMPDGDKELKINLGVGAESETKKENGKQKKSLRDLVIHKPKPTTKEPVAAKPVVAAEPQALISISDADWKVPALDFLSKKQTSADPGDCKQNAQIIQTTLADFGINVEMEGANVGPRITQYTMRPPSGVPLTKITSHDKELALNLAVEGQIRIEAPIPGTRLVGVEVPNARAASVGLRSILESKEWANAKMPLAFAVGKDISGKAVVADLAKMPHLLIAGTTGSGKSVMSNALILSLLYRSAPSDLKLIMIDPKQVEMAQYEDIPHLLTPVITSVEKALSAMKWSVNEMERRYTLMAKEKVKKIDDYNAKMAAGQKVTLKDEDGNEQQHDGGKMPYIVIIIDEMADLMMQAGKDLEALIVRIAQKGRAAGIHLVLATQSPKVQVITGLIKSNVPSRITFKVTNFTESSVALGMSGAEKLLGMGDMIMLTTEMGGKPRRVQSAYVSDEEIAAVTDYLREQRPPDYNDEVIAQSVQIKGMGPMDGGAIGDLGRRYDPNDPVVRKAIEITLRNGKFSTASLQTWLGKGHGFVSGLAIWLEEIGVIGPANGHKPRDVLIQSMEEFDQLANGGGE